MAVSTEESVPVVLTEFVTLTVEENVESEVAVAESVNEAVALWELVSVDSAVGVLCADVPTVSVAKAVAVGESVA